MIVKEQGAGGTSINILTVSLHLVRAFQFINHFHILMKFSKKMCGWVEKGCFFFFSREGKLRSNGVKIEDHITHEKKTQNKT